MSELSRAEFNRKYQFELEFMHSYGSIGERSFAQVAMDPAFANDFKELVWKVYQGLSKHANKLLKSRLTPGESKDLLSKVNLEVNVGNILGTVQSLLNQGSIDFKNPNLDDFYPYVAYISVHHKHSQRPDPELGLLVHKDGKIEDFEGSDEVSPEAIQVYNKLLRRAGVWVRVYSSQGSKVLAELEEGTAPKGIYVTSKLSIARSYWDMNEERYLVSFEVDQANLLPTANDEYVVTTATAIRNLKILGAV